MEAHPTSDELQAIWADVETELRGMVDEPTFNIHLAPLHLHDDGDELVVGADPKTATWIEHRFGRMLNRAAGKPVRLIACGCAVPVGAAA